jgi:hypothetical protein
MSKKTKSDGARSCDSRKYVASRGYSQENKVDRWKPCESCIVGTMKQFVVSDLRTDKNQSSENRLKGSVWHQKLRRSAHGRASDMAMGFVQFPVSFPDLDVYLLLLF